MYWGDAHRNKIETANIDGTGRSILLTETKPHYFAFALHAGHIYFTDWDKVYASIDLYLDHQVFHHHYHHHRMSRFL